MDPVEGTPFKTLTCAATWKFWQRFPCLCASWYMYLLLSLCFVLDAALRIWLSIGNFRVFLHIAVACNWLHISPHVMWQMVRVREQNPSYIDDASMTSHLKYWTKSPEARIESLEDFPSSNEWGSPHSLSNQQPLTKRRTLGLGRWSISGSPLQISGKSCKLAARRCIGIAGLFDFFLAYSTQYDLALIKRCDWVQLKWVSRFCRNCWSLVLRLEYRRSRVLCLMWTTLTCYPYLCFVPCSLRWGTNPALA